MAKRNIQYWKSEVSGKMYDTELYANISAAKKGLLPLPEDQYPYIGLYDESDNGSKTNLSSYNHKPISIIDVRENDILIGYLFQYPSNIEENFMIRLDVEEEKVEYFY